MIATLISESDLFAVVSPIIVALVALGIVLGRFHGRVSRIEEWQRLHEKEKEDE